MKNPFEFGRELGADELVDRQEEVAEVIRVIKGGEKLFVIGPRRYGKTSILKAADDRATRDGAVVLRYNAESYPTLNQLVAAS
jgi:AAA+ ATPase superfamily predicted ATPase